MIDGSLTGVPHRRFNWLSGEWVLVSPHRTARPWQGRIKDVIVHCDPQRIHLLARNGGFQRVFGRITGYGTMTATTEIMP